MTKTKRIEQFYRNIAITILTSDRPEAVFTGVSIEDITLSGEKWCIKQLIAKYESQVAEYQAFDIECDTDVKTLECLKTRMAKLETF